VVLAVELAVELPLPLHIHFLAVDPFRCELLLALLPFPIRCELAAEPIHSFVDHFRWKLLLALLAGPSHFLVVLAVLSELLLAVPVPAADPFPSTGPLPIAAAARKTTCQWTTRL